MGLTKLPPASLRELLKISFPMMLTSLSFFAMIFVDRLFLAAYDLNAMAAAVNASFVGLTFFTGLTTIAAIAEVYVGRYFGAGEEKNIGKPVWQMLWLSLFSIAFFLPLTFFVSDLIFGDGREFEAIYLKWMLLFAPFHLAYQAIGAFFIGRGKTITIAWVALISNGVNFILDYLLIFGVEGYIPSMGIKGAAIATSLSGLTQAAILFSIFLKKKNRRRFNTADWRFNYPLFKEEILVGLPGGLSLTCEFLGWSIFYEMMKREGQNHILIAGIFQSLYVFFYFIPDGLQKGLTAIISNYIGERKGDLIQKVILSSFTLLGILLCVGFVVTPWATSGIQEGFLKGGEPLLDVLLIHVWWIAMVYTILEGLRVTFLALLTSYKKTRFILLSGGVSVWLFLAFPFAALLTLVEPDEISALRLVLLFPLGHTLLLYLRARPLLRATTPQILAQ